MSPRLTDRFLAKLVSASRDLGASRLPNSRRSGKMIQQVETPLVIPQFAAIDDATARPIGGGAPYNCHLIDLTGAELTGTDFDAYELSGDRSVPDGQPVEVVPYEGGWGFRARRVAWFDDCCMIDEAAPGVASGTNEYATNTGVGATRQNLLVHLAGPILLSKGVYLHLQHTVTTAGGSTGCSFRTQLTALTDNFDPNDDGTPTPRLNTWTTGPTRGGVMSLALAGFTFTGTAGGILGVALDPFWFGGTLGASPVWGIEVELTNITVGGGTVSILTRARIGFSHVIAGT